MQIKYDVRVKAGVRIVQWYYRDMGKARDGVISKMVGREQT